METKRSKVSVLLDPDQFDRFDAYCDERGFKKSTLISRLIREHLDKEHFRMQPELPFAKLGEAEGYDRGR